MMPVEFLTHEQESRYGRFTNDPTPEQLARYFWLDDQDLALIWKHRGSHNQLGFAIQLGTVRFLGTFLPNPTDVSQNVASFVAEQLDLDVKYLDEYRTSESRWDHTREIRQMYGYVSFTDHPEHWRLVRWLYTRAWISAERPSVLFDLTTARCIEQKILLPGVSILEKLVARVRDQTSERLWKKLSRLPTPEQCQALETLLHSDPNTRKTNLDRLRKPPINLTAAGLTKAIHRFEEIRSFGAEEWDITGLPAGRLRILARYAIAARANAIKRMNPERRIATLAAFAKSYIISAQDDILDLLDRFMMDLFAKTYSREKKARLRALRDLDIAARQLREVCSVIVDDKTPDVDIRKALFSKISKENVVLAIRTVDRLTKPADQTVAFSELFSNYSNIRKFLPKLMITIKFKATPAGQPILEAWEFMKNHEGVSKKRWKQAPTAGMNASWQKEVIEDQQKGQVNPRAYTFWALEQMVEALRRHDVYVPGSERYGDPRAQLLQGAEWEALRPQVLRSLNWSSSAQESLTPLEQELDQAYRQTVDRWNENPAVRLETFAGKERVVLTPLERLEESDALHILRSRVHHLLPHPDLPDLILEVNRWTDFTGAFTHFSESNSRVKDLAVSVCAVLISQACNIGLEPVIQPGIPALERDRLTWIEQNYFRAETLTQANARLVEFHSQLKLAQTWGGGEVASADGLRFVNPVRTIHSGPNPKYFGTGRGVTYYNFTSDQFTGLHGLVIPGTIRDSLYLLQCVLEQETVLRPQEIMTDTAGYSDIIFGLFGLLGYQFSPRLADIGESRFWRFESDADYGVLNKLSRNRIRKDLICKYWEDMLRVSGSLKLNTVNATRLIQTLQRGGKPTMLGRAIGEFGRIFKTRYLLAFLDDEGYRRRIFTQLNRGESRHSLARAVFYGKRGELHQHYREGQEIN